MPNNSKHLLVTLALGLGLLAALMWLQSGWEATSAAPLQVQRAAVANPVAPPTEVRVCPSGCTYSSIQAAVDAASPGTHIKVAQGEYGDVHARGGITQVLHINKTITVSGGYTTTEWTTPDPEAYPTILDAGGKGRVLYLTGGNGATIEGLHITGGDAAGLQGDPWGNDAGGGIFVNAPVLVRNNRIYSNTAYNGAGMYLDYPILVLIQGNTIISNTATDSGGGFYQVSGKVQYEANVIKANTAEAGRGGGLVINGGSPTLRNNVIVDNWAGREASGLFIYGGGSRFSHTTIARNSCHSDDDCAGVYFSHPGGPGAEGAIVLTNTIIMSHTVGIRVKLGNTATLTGTLWYANKTPRDAIGTINHTTDQYGDPLFAADGYHIRSGSAASNLGVEAGSRLDMDGDRRPQCGNPDLGADELGCIYLPLLMRKYP